jgi:hypothetical protein
MPRDPKAITLGPGKMYVADAGTADPTVTFAANKIVVTPGAAFQDIGYTDNGSQITYSITSEPVRVAEELEDVAYKTTGRAGAIAFEMAEETVRNLTLAFNGGTVTTTGTGATEGWTYEPPALGSEKRRCLFWVSQDETMAFFFRQVFQTGSVTIGRRPGAEKSTIPVEFSMEKPTGQTAFKAWGAGATRGGGAVAGT